MEIDKERYINGATETGILVGASENGKYGSWDIAYLKRDDLIDWLKSRGGDNLLAENVVLIMLNHNEVTGNET